MHKVAQVKKKFLWHWLLAFFLGGASPWGPGITVKRVAVFLLHDFKQGTRRLSWLKKIQKNIIIGFLEKRRVWDRLKRRPEKGNCRLFPASMPPLAAEIGKKLGADAVITGSLIKIGPTVALEGELTDLTGKNAAGVI